MEEIYCFDDLFLKIQNFNPQVFYSTTCCYETDSKFLERTVDSNYTFPSLLLKSAIHNSIEGRDIKFISIGTSLPSTLNLYSLTKKQFSELGEFYSKIKPVQFINVLLESFYGSDEPRNRFILNSVSKLKSNKNLQVTEGKQHRDYVAVRDVIDILVYIGTKAEIDKRYDVIPLGSGEAPSIREILEYLKEITNSKSVIEFGAVPSRSNEPSTRADLTRLREIGYDKQIIYWKDGLKEFVKEFDNEIIN